MAIEKAQIVKRSFTDTTTGQLVEFDAIELIGVVHGEMYTLRLRLTGAEKTLAKILLTSDEQPLTTTTRQATYDEQPTISRQHSPVREKETDGRSVYQSEGRSILDDDEE